MQKIKNVLVWLLVLAVVTASLWVYFIVPKYWKSVTSDRTVFKAQPGLTCVQVTSYEAIALSCVKD